MNIENMTKEELAALVPALLAKLEAANKPKAITLKVTQERINEKTGKAEGSNGAISVYGLGRFPVTLYRSQWERLFACRQQIADFIRDNAAILATKD